MAVRLGYVYCTGENKIEIKQFEFKWVAGGSLKSNRACILELHKVIEESGFGRALDVSVNTEGKLARSLIYKNIWNTIMKDRTILNGKFGNPIYNDDYFTIAAISKNKELSMSKESNTTLSITKHISANTNFKHNYTIPINQNAKTKYKMSPFKRNTPIINFLNKRKSSFSPTNYRAMRTKKQID